MAQRSSADSLAVSRVMLEFFPLWQRRRSRWRAVLFLLCLTLSSLAWWAPRRSWWLEFSQRNTCGEGGSWVMGDLLDDVVVVVEKKNKMLVK